MKRLLLLFAFLFSVSASGQSLEDKLKAQVLKLETANFSKSNQPASDIQFVTFEYKLIPIKDWWKRLYDVSVEFRTQMILLTNESYGKLRIEDKAKGTHKADVLADSVRKEAQKEVDLSEEEAYFKAKYEHADSSEKVYEVFYQLKYKQAGRDVVARKIRHAFHQNDLSEVRSFN
ncbi:hypothetical protein [Spirosoma sp. KNUC1025]|uniref:hypothetical protein n=1 Tax=Spirosoma sp. KNUC1025 TaxID=2894082 RepID=UPI0038708734|nr:hypothetical protein LN737_20645 [Spirosoma sp. KNUC1025]